MNDLNRINIFPLTAPCRGCTSRSIYCHTECEKYLDYKRGMEEYHNAMNEERKYNYYVSQRLDRLSKIARRNK